MARRLRLPLILVIAVLAAFAGPASAQDWHGWDDQTWGQNPDPSYDQPPDPSYDQPPDPSWDPNWDPYPQDDSGDTPSDDTTPAPEDTTPAPDPQIPDGGAQLPNGGHGWNPHQGDAPENPRNWTDGNNRRSHGGGGWNVPPLPVSKTPTVSGKTAMIRRNGLAAIPRSAPARVKAILVAANKIIGKPYKWGGGHGRLFDSGYDCSGSVSYALIRAGILPYPMVSGTFARWGAKGLGKYVTIYANRGHVYMEVAGLRLDTSSVGDSSGKSGVRWRPPIGKRVTFAMRHVPGL